SDLRKESQLFAASRLPCLVRTGKWAHLRGGSTCADEQRFALSDPSNAQPLRGFTGGDSVALGRPFQVDRFRRTQAEPRLHFSISASGKSAHGTGSSPDDR